MSVVGASSADHIELVQTLTEGHILVSMEKRPSIHDLRFYEAIHRLHPPNYFVNCPFPGDILTREHRDADLYALRPGLRLDVTLDFEKQKPKPGEKGKVKFVKDEVISDQEKADLLHYLEKVEYIAWAGRTPHGVHAGIYLTAWIPKERSEMVLNKVTTDLKAAGYQGPVQLDWGASMNYNRPSRFLRSFTFWRPEARLTLSAPSESSTKATNVQRAAKKASTTPGLAPDPTEQLALRARTDFKTAEETANEVGKSVAWVTELWAKNPQKTFSPWNRKVGLVDETGNWRFIGPRTKRGKANQGGPELYEHIAWSWEWCRKQGMDEATATTYVFEAPEFAELLDEIKRAWDEDKRTNLKDPPKTASWQAWLKLDIERCYAKYANWVSPETLTRVRKAISELGKRMVTVANVLRETGEHTKISRTTIRLAFKKLGLRQHGSGKNSRYQVPDELLSPPLSQPPTSTQPVEKPVPPPAQPEGATPTPLASLSLPQSPCAARMCENHASLKTEPEEEKKKPKKSKKDITPIKADSEEPNSEEPNPIITVDPRARQIFRLDVAEVEMLNVEGNPETTDKLILKALIETSENLLRIAKKRTRLVVFPEHSPIYLIKLGKCFGGKRQIRGLVEVLRSQIKRNFGQIGAIDTLTAKSGRTFLELMCNCDWPDSDSNPHLLCGQVLHVFHEQRRFNVKAKKETRATFCVDKFSGLVGFMANMTNPGTPELTALAGKFTGATRKAMEDYDVLDLTDVGNSVVKELNIMLRKPAIFDTVELDKFSAKTKEVFAKTQANGVIRTNRVALEGICPELREDFSRFPGEHGERWAIILSKTGPVDTEVASLIADAQWDGQMWR